MNPSYQTAGKGGERGHVSLWKEGTKTKRVRDPEIGMGRCDRRRSGTTTPAHQATSANAAQVLARPRRSRPYRPRAHARRR